MCVLLLEPFFTALCPKSEETDAGEWFWNLFSNWGWRHLQGWVCNKGALQWSWTTGQQTVRVSKVYSKYDVDISRHTLCHQKYGYVQASLFLMTELNTMNEELCCSWVQGWKMSLRFIRKLWMKTSTGQSLQLWSMCLKWTTLSWAGIS